MKNKKAILQDWGLTGYREAWDRQETLFAETVKLKTVIRNRSLAVTAGDAEPEQEILTPNYLIFCEHPHVYTLGKSGKAEH